MHIDEVRQSREDSRSFSYRRRPVDQDGSHSQGGGGRHIVDQAIPDEPTLGRFDPQGIATESGRFRARLPRPAQPAFVLASPYEYVVIWSTAQIVVTNAIGWRVGLGSQGHDCGASTRIREARSLTWR
jgi:hypothetical protein